MRESISKKIKLLRLEKGISQKQLSDYLGISDRAISKWENGLSNPSVENSFELSKIFQVSLDYFTTKDKLKDKIEPTLEGMESITELYKIGRGPSSSHTIGPERACIRFRENNNEADKFSAILYGSLAKTGRGHGTDVVIRKTFAPISCDVEFNYLESNILHPNTFDLIAYKNDIIINRARVYSIGGGSIKFENQFGWKDMALILFVMVIMKVGLMEYGTVLAEQNIKPWIILHGEQSIPKFLK